MSEDVRELGRIGIEMAAEGLPPEWVIRAVAVARESRGTAKLFRMWRRADDVVERNEIVAEIDGLLRDREPSPGPSGARSLGDVHRVADDRAAWKRHLRALIDEHGGVNEVARRARLPQPSLSRLLNDLSEPRATTLARLAEAMGVHVRDLRPSDASHARPPAHVVDLGVYQAATLGAEIRFGGPSGRVIG